MYRLNIFSCTKILEQNYQAGRNHLLSTTKNFQIVHAAIKGNFLIACPNLANHSNIMHLISIQLSLKVYEFLK